MFLVQTSHLHIGKSICYKVWVSHPCSLKLNNLLVEFLLFLAHFFYQQFSYWRYIFRHSTYIQNVPCNWSTNTGSKEIVWNMEPEGLDFSPRQKELAAWPGERVTNPSRSQFPHLAARGSVWITSAEAPCSWEAPGLLAVSTISNWIHIFQSHTRWGAGLSQHLGRPIRTRAGLSLWGLEKRSSWSNTISFLPIQKRTIELPPGDTIRSLTVWGLSYWREWRITVEYGCLVAVILNTESKMEGKPRGP